MITVLKQFIALVNPLCKSSSRLYKLVWVWAQGNHVGYGRWSLIPNDFI